MTPPVLTATPYHQQMVDYLQQEEAKLWAWLNSETSFQSRLQSTRLSLLKSMVRLDRETHERVYAAADQGVAALALDAPVTLYQSPLTGEGLNAALWYIPGEAHVTFQGPVMEALTDDELTALLGHELAHYKLWQDNAHEYLIADRILHELSVQPDVGPHHLRSNRIYQLYTETYADRGAYLAVNSVLPVIAMLVKVSTGLTKVNAEAYLAQANEIFQVENPSTQGISHPETYIRARAIWMWADQVADSELNIAAMIKGEARLERLDVLDQADIKTITFDLLYWLLSKPWMQTEATLAHARFFGVTEMHSPELDLGGLKQRFQALGHHFTDYWCYLILDFASIETGSEDAPLIWCVHVADELGLEDAFGACLRKELKLTKKRIKQLRSTTQA